MLAVIKIVVKVLKAVIEKSLKKVFYVGYETHFQQYFLLLCFVCFADNFKTLNFTNKIFIV